MVEIEIGKSDEYNTRYGKLSMAVISKEENQTIHDLAKYQGQIQLNFLFLKTNDLIDRKNYFFSQKC